jgi:hypothetical protein
MQNDAIRPEFCGSIGVFGLVMVTTDTTERFDADWFGRV